MSRHLMFIFLSVLSLVAVSQQTKAASIDISNELATFEGAFTQNGKFIEMAKQTNKCPPDVEPKALRITYADSPSNTQDILLINKGPSRPLAGGWESQQITVYHGSPLREDSKWNLRTKTDGTKKYMELSYNRKPEIGIAKIEALPMNVPPTNVTFSKGRVCGLIFGNKKVDEDSKGAPAVKEHGG